jgi:hypothetical protein
LLALLTSGLWEQAAHALPPAEGLPGMLAAVPGADLVFFDEPQAGGATRVLVAARMRVAAERLRAVLLDPAAYRRAVPSFRRAEVVERKGGSLRVAWELEVPLWNLDGTLWLRPAPDGVDLELVEGDLAPGLFRVRFRPERDGVLLWVDAHANMRDANWATRRLVSRSHLAEPAMTAAASWVLARALLLEADRPAQGVDPRRAPRAPLAPPPLGTLDGRALGLLARGRVGTGHAVAAVRSRSNGRLERVEVATLARHGAPVVRRALAESQRWRALPGWHRVHESPGKPPPAVSWVVDSRFPFVDFDATWWIDPGPPLRGQVVDGDARGAVVGWDVVDGPAPHTAVAVVSLHPRLEAAGYIPRKFIEAEPLLEHGLSLGLTYVDALSLVSALQGKQ